MSPLRCPYCLGDLEHPVACTSCFSPHHAACFREHGRCTQLGCEGTETTRDQAASMAPGWELHPLLASEAPDHQARFISLQIRHDPAPEVRRRPRLRSRFPTEVACGSLLEGTLRAFVPRALHGRGLRLRVELAEPPEHRYRAEAVVLGAAHRSWLERLRLSQRASESLLFGGGRTDLLLRLDPSPLVWRARIDEHPRFGVYHSLELQLSLESSALAWEGRRHRVLVRHVPGRCGHRRLQDPWPDARLR